MSELDPQAKELIGLALEGEGPTVAERSRVRGAVLARVGASVAIVAAVPGTAAATTATAGATAGGAIAVGFVTKVVAAIVLAGAVGAGGYVALSDHGGASGGATRPLAEGVAESVSQSVTVLRVAPLVGASPAASAAPVSAPSAVAVAAVVASTPRNPTAAIVVEPIPQASASSAPDVSLDEETRALRSAIADLRDGQLDRALMAIDAQDDRFPRGALAEERAEARIAVLCALGRNDEARVDAARFLGAHPRSLLAGRVRASCGMK
jgi:hypothetical protein